MRAVAYHGPRDVRVEAVSDPKIQVGSDANVRIVNAAISGVGRVAVQRR